MSPEERDEALEDLATQEEHVREAQEVTRHVRELHRRVEADLAKVREQNKLLQRAAKWLPHEGEPLDEEALRGIKIRWATGPMEYQADADALIGAVLALTRERDDWKAVAERARLDYAAEKARTRRLTEERDEARRRRDSHAEDADRMETAMGSMELRALRAEAEVKRLRGTNLAGAEERLRVLASSGGMSQAWDGAWYAEGPNLVKSVLMDLDRERAEVERLRSLLAREKEDGRS